MSPEPTPLAGSTFIHTRSGAFVDLLSGIWVAGGANPFDIIHIAIGLNRAARFAGQTPGARIYTNAQHVLACATLAADRDEPLEVQLACLWHDAHEAIIGDVLSPLVWAMDAESPGAARALEAIKARLDQVILAANGLPPDLIARNRPTVDEIDRLVTTAELIRVKGMPSPLDAFTPDHPRRRALAGAEGVVLNFFGRGAPLTTGPDRWADWAGDVIDTHRVLSGVFAAMPQAGSGAAS